MADITLHHADCMDIMRGFPDKYFDLLIADPPYGINAAKKGSIGGGDKNNPSTKFTPKNWDNCSPDKAYFDEAIRVSKNQIFWGFNHYIDKIPYPTSSIIFWDKLNGTTGFADGEMAWTSFKTSIRKIPFLWNGYCQGYAQSEKEKRIHPTQKPVYVYKWLLYHYAKEGQKILDTHLGSASIAIACHDLGFDLTGIELDKEYFDDATQRINDHKRKLSLDFTQQKQINLML